MPQDQFVVVIFAVVPVVLLLIFGLAALLSNSTRWAATCEAIAHGGFAFGGLMSLYFIVPRFKKMFADFGTELPVMTKSLIILSDLTVNYWYILLFLILVGTAIDVLAFVAFHRNKEVRYVARVFSAIVTVMLLAQGAFSGTALVISLGKLTQDLQ